MSKKSLKVVSFLVIAMMMLSITAFKTAASKSNVN